MKSSVTYVSSFLVEAARQDAETYTGGNADGYGIFRSPYSLKYDGRWHRVYAMSYSNVASFYIKKKGSKLFLDPKSETLIEDSRA